jgi:hypothetical protein
VRGRFRRGSSQDHHQADGLGHVGARYSCERRSVRRPGADRKNEKAGGDHWTGAEQDEQNDGQDWNEQIVRRRSFSANVTRNPINTIISMSVIVTRMLISRSGDIAISSAIS